MLPQRFTNLPLIEICHVLAKCLFAFLARKSHFSSSHQGMLLLFSMALGAIEPFPTCVLVQPLFLVSADVDSQHGDRIDTCAFNICLLGRSDCEKLLDITDLPHDIP